MICSICSDKAEGYHFGAISCAACGAFFRRSVSDQKVYACSNRTCNIAHDVKAKRSSGHYHQSSTSLYRTMNQSSILLIDQIIGFRRNIAAERPGFEAMRGPINRANLMVFLHQDYENVKRIAARCPLFMQIIENLNTPFGSQQKASQRWEMEDPLRDIFLVVFVFEACCLTSSKGGVQLDRLVLPNLMFVDLSEHAFIEFLQFEPPSESARNVHNAFSFLVQLAARSFQSANFDESFLAVLLYTVLTETVPLSFRHRFAEVNRESLLADLNRVDPATGPQFHTITGHIHHGTRVFKDVISGF
ncbi:unnamed protein product [Caenorhabditis sp. 36 PRJEB53466]|nr:unnamed protein product [Caenorhabditis sp. 36 PRJEB53466]